jgi:alpha-amylase
VLRRRPEAYHARLQAFESGAPGPAAESDAPASIHDIVKVREPGLSRLLTYDAYERRTGLVHLLAPDTAPDAFAAGTAHELGDQRDGPFRVVSLADGVIALERDGRASGPDGEVPVRIATTMRYDADRRSPGAALEVTVTCPGPGRIVARLGLEWAVTMLGGGGNPSAWLEVAGERDRFDRTGSAVDVSSLAFGNDYVGVEVTLTADPPADAWWSSIDTVSLSEDGFERTHQGTSLLFSWPLRLESGASATVRVGQRVTTAYDRSEEEGL